MKKPPTAIRMAAALLAASLALAGACAVAQTDAAAQQATATTGAWPDPDLDARTLDALRWAAAVGNVDAALVVATRLVDRFERGGKVDDLYEALIWIDRYHGEETFAHAPLMARIQQKDCDQKILRYHWLCEIGE